MLSTLDAIEQRAAHTIALHTEALEASTRPERRQEITRQLEAIRSSDDWQLACFLVEKASDLSSQFFGAQTLYEIIKIHSANLLESAEVADTVRKFLFDVLSQGADSKSHSLINKLSSAMAIFALTCVPDIWDSCICDITCAWSSQPELLLRVLAEMPIEFYNLKVPLSQRSAIKSFLERESESVIRIIQTVFERTDCPPSLCNAAIECVESWTKLPNASVISWKPILMSIFQSNTQECSTIARLLNILTSKEELGKMDGYVLEVAECIDGRIIPFLIEQMQSTEFRDAAGEPIMNLEDEVAHITALIEAISGFYEVYVHTLCKYAFPTVETAENKYLHILRGICSFFLTISAFPGHYPVEECFSDRPDNFWSELRTALISALEAQSPNPSKLLVEFLKKCEHEYYANFIKFLIQKLACSESTRNKFTKEEIDKWESYRETRLCTARNVFLSYESTILQVVLSLFREAVNARNICLAESVYHVIQEIGDLITEKTVAFITEMISVGTATDFAGFNEFDAQKFISSLLKVIHNTASCVVDCGDDEKEDVKPCCDIFQNSVGRLLHFMSNPQLTEQSLATLVTLLEGRTKLNKLVEDDIFNKCFAYYADGSHNSKNRITSLCCIGYCLSVKPYNDVVSALQMIMSDKTKLEALGDGTFSADDAASAERQFLFELDVYISLTESIRMKNKEEDPCALLLNTYVPTFCKLITRYSSNEKLTSKVTTALRAGLRSVDPNSDEFFMIYSRVIDELLLSQPTSANKLAQSFLLTFAGNKSAYPILMEKIADWTAAIQSNWTNANAHERTVIGDMQEELLKFLTSITRKHWNIIMNILSHDGHQQNVYRYFEALVVYLCDNIGSSCNAEVVRKSVAILNFVNSKNDDVISAILKAKGEIIVATLFIRLQTDLLSSIVNLITDVLQFFYCNYSQETRAVIGSLPNSQDIEVVKAMGVNPANKREFLILLRNFHKRVACSQNYNS